MIITDYKTLSYEIPTHRVYGFGDYSGLGDDEPYFKNYNDRFINPMIMDVKTHIQNKWVLYGLPTIIISEMNGSSVSNLRVTFTFVTIAEKTERTQTDFTIGLACCPFIKNSHSSSTDDRHINKTVVNYLTRGWELYGNCYTVYISYKHVFKLQFLIKTELTDKLESEESNKDLLESNRILAEATKAVKQAEKLVEEANRRTKQRAILEKE